MLYSYGVRVQRRLRRRVLQSSPLTKVKKRTLRSTEGHYILLRDQDLSVRQPRPVETMGHSAVRDLLLSHLHLLPGLSFLALNHAPCRLAAPTSSSPTSLSTPTLLLWSLDLSPLGTTHNAMVEVGSGRQENLLPAKRRDAL